MKQSEVKLKKNIGEGMKMFWKYQLAVWLSIRNFDSHFTTVTSKCECFGHIVEPCDKMTFLEAITNTIHLKFDSNWYTSFRGDDQNVKLTTNGRRPKHSHLLVTVVKCK
jgi:hypothetical protein